MMKKKNTLSVKPLRRYNTPIYPSYLDKNPIEYPDTLPYPLNRKALNVLVAVGVLVGSATMSGCGILSPFKFNDLGVPFKTTSFGTGMASRLSSEEAREVINRIFKQEGIYLQKNYDYKKGEVSVLLDGFDPKRNIGYIWIDNSNRGDGMIINRSGLKGYDKIINRKLLDFGIDKLHDAESLIEEIIKSIHDNQKFNERFEAAKKIEIDEEKLQVYKALYLDIYIVYLEKHEFKADFKHIKHLLDSDISFKEKEKIYHLFSFLGRQISIHNQLTKHDIKDVLSEILLEIISIEDEAQKRNQYNNFSAFLEAHSAENRAKIENGAAQEILSLKDKKKMAEEIQVLGFNYSDKKISLEEAKQLQGRHKGNCIAPISVRDERFSYDYNDGYPYKTPAELDQVKSGNFKSDALKRLETQVHQYIRWAKLQGAY